MKEKKLSKIFCSRKNFKLLFSTLIILIVVIPTSYFHPVALCGWAAKADDSFVCFGAKPDKGFLDLKSRRIRKWEGDVKESWRRDPAERQLALDSREASSRELAWNHGQGQSTLDSGDSRGDKIGSSEEDWVSRCLHSSCLWNFR